MIYETSEAILALLTKHLYPRFLSNQDLIALCIPRQDHQACHIGIYLYDLSTDQSKQPGYATIIDQKRIFPDKLMQASYVIYLNEEAQFTGFSKEYEEILLEKLIQILHDEGSILVKGKQVQLQFENMDMETKIRLWQSFQKPLQPALYVKALPIAIASLKEEDVRLVHQIDVEVNRKG